MLKDKYGITKARSPETQCITTLSNGAPCTNERIEGSDYCSMHGGNRVVETQKKKAMYEFYRTKYIKDKAERLPEFSRNKFNLETEIGILRIQLEELLNKCEDENDLLRFQPKINDLITRIEKTTTAALKLDQKIGSLLTKEQMVDVAQKLLNVIQEEIDDLDKVKIIADRFTEILWEDPE